MRNAGDLLRYVELLWFIGGGCMTTAILTGFWMAGILRDSTYLLFMVGFNVAAIFVGGIIVLLALDWFYTVSKEVELHE